MKKTYIPSLAMLGLLIAESTLYVDSVLLIIAILLCALVFSGMAVYHAIRRRWRFGGAYLAAVVLAFLWLMPATLPARDALSDARNRLEFKMRADSFQGQGPWTLGSRGERSFQVVRTRAAAQAMADRINAGYGCFARVVELTPEFYLLDAGCV
jgi:hypothetical protein